MFISNKRKDSYKLAMPMTLDISEIFDALSTLVQSVQFKRCARHPWKRDTFSKVAGLNQQL